MAPRVPERITWAVEQLAVGPNDHVLEIGCGRGVAVGLICTQLTSGRLTAIDRSKTMIAAAQRNNRVHESSGKVIFQVIDLSGFDGSPNQFDKALAININVFWLHPDAELRVLSHVLKPGGELCLVFQPPSEAKVNAISTECTRLLAQQGFTNIHVIHKEMKPVTAVCVHSITPNTPSWPG